MKRRGFFSKLLGGAVAAAAVAKVAKELPPEETYKIEASAFRPAPEYGLTLGKDTPSPARMVFTDSSSPASSGGGTVTYEHSTDTWTFNKK